MTEFMTRRERLEAERRGENTRAPEAIAPIINNVEPTGITFAAPAESGPILSRRQLREAERQGKRPGLGLPTAKESVQLEVKLPDIEISDPRTASEEIAQIVIGDVTEIDMPPVEFTGNNLLAEPSTQSIVLDVAPEAIALPIETGEIAVTGSIAVLTEPSTGSFTGSLDGIELDNLDRQDAVTGVISIVEPMSALDVINGRVNVGVVPKSVLRKGWWRPWVYALAAVAMAVAAILATVTILNAIGA